MISRKNIVKCHFIFVKSIDIIEKVAFKSCTHSFISVPELINKIYDSDP
jgi:hypothetical protein